MVSGGGALDKKPEQEEIAVGEWGGLDIQADRETSLSGGFDDAAVVQEIQATTEGGQPLAAETVEAVQELVGIQNITGISAEDATSFLDASATEDRYAVAKAQMAEELFSLVLCEHGFDTLTEQILRSLMKSVDAQAGSLLELDQEKSEFFFRASVGGGDPDKLKAFRIPAYNGIVGHVAESRQPLLIRDMEDSAMHLKAISMSVGFETKSCVALPLVIANQLYGVVEVFNKLPGGYFDNRDLSILEDGCRMAGKVLEVRFFVAELARGKAG
ncbi:MAG: GAF domain-containing protein [Bdellovibrionales bacterium]|nr:GAF domain-containing protein [Bdellovibrionales bacterium]